MRSPHHEEEERLSQCQDIVTLSHNNKSTIKSCISVVLHILPVFSSIECLVRNAAELTVHYRPISLCLVSTLVRTRATCFHSFICPPFSLILYLLSSRDKETKRGPGLQEVVLCKRLIGEVVQSRRRPLPGPFLVESGYYHFHI